MSPILPRRTAVSAIYSHCRALVLEPTTAGARTVPTRTMRAVLLAVAYYLDAGTWSGAFPSMATLAARAEVSVTTARRAVRALEAAGVLVTELGGGRKSSRYRIVPPAGVGTGLTTDANGAQDDAGTGQASRSGTGVPGQKDRRSPVCTSLSPFGRKRQARPAASKSKQRSTTIPEDLRPLADALVGRGLRAAYGLTAQQADEVRAVLGRVGIPAMVSAAYRAHRATNPAVWWSAWVGMWSGLHVPATPVRTPSPDVPVTPDAGGTERTMSGAAAARAAIAAARRGRVQVAA